MGISRRVFTREFKMAAMKELESGRAAGYVARQMQVSREVLYRWRREFRERPANAFSGNGKRVISDSREAELERKIGQMTMENDFLKKLLQRFEEQPETDCGGRRYTNRSRKKGKR